MSDDVFIMSLEKWAILKDQSERPSSWDVCFVS